MFIGVLYHRFRWGISFFIRCKSRSVSTFSLASANVKARILKEWKLIKGNHIFTHYQSITFLYLQFYCHNDLNNQFTRFGSAQTPVNIMLFGDDLPKSGKEISEQTKWVSKFHSSSQDITTSSKGDQISLITSTTKIRSLFHGKLREWGRDLL